MTWADLIAEVRAQIDVTDNQAYAWLLDRARIMNAETDWGLMAVLLTGVTDQVEHPLGPDVIKVEAVVVDRVPYRRSTLAGLDHARTVCSTKPIYAGAPGWPIVSIWPPPTDGAEITVRLLTDVPDDRAGSPFFPVDLHSCLADGAIATGLARMDERFDSAGYFEARFTDGVARLRRRRHSRVGRGGVAIRLMPR
ncbi:MAG TPA: hypothetical protein VK631_15270 [Solirubrobacteraceae bacterium]|nr:hypothetical protein [Solirubrobacteraceae bacterium]